MLSEPLLFSFDPDVGRPATVENVAVVEAALASRGPAAAVDAFFALVCPGLWSSLGQERKDRSAFAAEVDSTTP